MADNTISSTARSVDIRFGPLFARQLFPLTLVVLLLWLARDHFPVLDMREIWRTFQQVSAGQWIVATIATGFSFWAVGRYDSVIHGLLGSPIAPTHARHSGVTAIAIAQFAGFGVITGALVRWRLLPELALTQAFRVSLTVSMSFLAGWAVLTSLAVLASGSEIPHAQTAAGLVLGFAGLVGAFLLLRPRYFRQMPTLQSVTTILTLVTVDTVFAALALYVLLPGGIDIGPLAFLTAFLVALGAGLIGGTPGGVGPFELCLIALLPSVSDASLLASALAFRLVYYLLPAAIGLIVLFLGLPKGKRNTLVTLDAPAPGPYLPPQLERQMWTAPRAEANLIRQGEFAPIRHGQDVLAIAAPVGQNLVMLGDAVCDKPNTKRAIAAFLQTARRAQRSPLIYKCAPRTALAGRKLGWAAIPVAKEAWIDPRVYSTDGSTYRQLRRSLRRCEKSGVTVTEAGRDLPLDDMQALSDRWSRKNGGQRGFSMGTFQRDYINCQRVFLAHQGERLVGFISFHVTRNDWALDLMRQDTDTPPGTMHMLVTNAIKSAAAIACPRLSLAAVPHTGGTDTPLVARLRKAFLKRSDHAGLMRFKNCFAPNWTPLYAMAPNRRGLLLGLLSVYLRINKTQ